MEINKIYNEDCIVFMHKLSDNTVNFTLTDIPYDKVNRKSNGIRNFDKGSADILTFNLLEFCEEVYRVTKNSICIFAAENNFPLYMIILLKNRVQQGVLFGKRPILHP